MEKKSRGTPRRPRQSPMLAPHTDSLSCGLLASGNVAAHHFEVEADMKGSGRNGKGGRGGVRLGMADTPHVHQHDIRGILITSDRNRWKPASLKSTRMNKIYIFILVVWRYERIIQEKTEKVQNDIQRKFIFWDAGTFRQRNNVSQKSCEDVVFKRCIPHSEESHDLAQMWFSLTPLC